MPKTRSVGKYLERKADNWMVYRDVPKDVRKAIGKARFKKSLHTTSMAVAEDRKGKWLKLWDLEIDIARGKVDLKGEDPDEVIASATRLVDAAEDAGATFAQNFAELAFKLDVRNQPFEKQKELAQIHSQAMGVQSRASGTSTAKYIDEFFNQAEYAPEVGIEGKRYMEDVFSKKFPIFEHISTEQLAAYCYERLNGTDGKNKWAKTTLRKNLNFAKQYWEYCETVYIKVPNLIDYGRILPKTVKTKAARLKTQNSNLAYSMKQVYEILDAAIEQAERTNKQGDHNLVDLIRLGMYTGCRIEELCSMKVADVLPEAFCIKNAKTPSGERLVPMHKDVKQVVERLKQTSFDGYLLPGESTANKTKSRKKGLSGRFGRLQKKLGIPADNVLTFHSYRSTLARRFETAKVDEILAARIIGHKVNSITYGVYSQGTDWEILFNTMNDHISFPRPEDSNAE